jgi:hypothetical protein
MMGCTAFSHCKRLGDDGLWDWNGINELSGGTETLEGGLIG